MNLLRHAKSQGLLGPSARPGTNSPYYISAGHPFCHLLYEAAPKLIELFPSLTQDHDLSNCIDSFSRRYRQFLEDPNSRISLLLVSSSQVHQDIFDVLGNSRSHLESAVSRTHSGMIRAYNWLDDKTYRADPAYITAYHCSPYRSELDIHIDATTDTFVRGTISKECNQSLSWLVHTFPALAGCLLRRWNELTYLDGVALCNKSDIVQSVAFLTQACRDHEYFSAHFRWSDLESLVDTHGEFSIGLRKSTEGLTQGLSIAKKFGMAMGIPIKQISTNEWQQMDLPRKDRSVLSPLLRVSAKTSTATDVLLRDILSRLKLTESRVLTRSGNQSLAQSTLSSVDEILDRLKQKLQAEEKALMFDYHGFHTVVGWAFQRVAKLLAERLPAKDDEEIMETWEYKKLVNFILWESTCRESNVLVGRFGESSVNALTIATEAVEAAVAGNERYASQNADQAMKDGLVDDESRQDVEVSQWFAPRRTSTHKIELIGKSLTITSVAAMSRAELAHLPDGDEQSSAHDDQEGDSKSRRQERRRRCKAEKKAAKKAAKEAGAGELGVDRGDGNPVS
ncbi:hypothetical protein CLAFUW4_08545 [Fulvia fulva]|uniref:Uncharacterized protein n=1 Tax=Passalora fulva TaxID=5499 RepID=A0A9Q8LET0_PASFU|nr:uncharacterized protein CLAFUR5_08647 [Fulvia fulva]UJO15368.1 hypothetical protein CLAFUR5_08647 [Fulvia fulva]WPV12340.1 hypothetical protein CLAFUW4_08545 [Fulvia fulva]